MLFPNRVQVDNQVESKLLKYSDYSLKIIEANSFHVKWVVGFSPKYASLVLWICLALTRRQCGDIG